MPLSRPPLLLVIFICCTPYHSGLRSSAPLLPVIGVPTDSDRVFCRNSMNNTCYFYNSIGATYANAKAACKAKGGNLVSYNSAEEQLAVERYFSASYGTGVLTSIFCIGLEKSNVTYYWLDGTNAGGGPVSNANPCVT